VTVDGGDARVLPVEADSFNQNKFPLANFDCILFEVDQGRAGRIGLYALHIRRRDQERGCRKGSLVWPVPRE
jgi:hypothetical protein